MQQESTEEMEKIRNKHFEEATYINKAINSNIYFKRKHRQFQAAMDALESIAFSRR